MSFASGGKLKTRTFTRLLTSRLRFTNKEKSMENKNFNQRTSRPYFRAVGRRILLFRSRNHVSWPDLEPRELKTVTHEEACSLNRLVQQICPWSLLPRIKPVWLKGCKTREQKFGYATKSSARNRWCRRGSFAPGACCRSVLREQAPRV